MTKEKGILVICRAMQLRLIALVFAALSPAAFTQDPQPPSAPFDTIVFRGYVPVMLPPSCKVNRVFSLQDGRVGVVPDCGTDLLLVDGDSGSTNALSTGCTGIPNLAAQLTDGSIAFVCPTDGSGQLRVRRLDLSGNVLWTVAVPSGVVSLTEAAAAQDGSYLLRDFRRLLRYSLTGELVAIIGTPGNGIDEIGNVRYFFPLEGSRVAICHLQSSNRLSLFSLEGVFLDSVSTRFCGPDSNAFVDAIAYAGGFIASVGGTNVNGLYARPSSQSRALGVFFMDLQAESVGSGLFLPGPGAEDGLVSAVTGKDIYALVFEGLERRIAAFQLSYGTASSSVGATQVPTVDVRSVAPRPASTIIDIDYVVRDVDSAGVAVRAVAFRAGELSLSSLLRISTLIDGTAVKVGDGIATNSVHRLSWDAGVDLASEGAFVNASIHVAANDGRGLVDLAFITLPANVPSVGDPALTISTHVVGDRQLLPFWLWLVASNDAGITFANGEVRAASGPLAGQLLASGTTTTAAGREFAFARLGVREATAAEAQRARTGTTPGIQQYNPTRYYGIVPDRVNEIGVETGSTPGVHVVRLN